MSPATLSRRVAAQQALADLRRYRQDLTRERLIGDRDEQRKVLHALYAATQACIDEATYLCARRQLDADSYRGAFLALASAAAIKPELAAAMADWASLRNVLAHFYPVIDLDKVWAALADLDELETFMVRAAELEP